MNRVLGACSLVLLGLVVLDIRGQPEAIPAPKQAKLESGIYAAKDKGGWMAVEVKQVGPRYLVRWTNGQSGVGREDDGAVWVGGAFGIMKLVPRKGSWEGQWWDNKDSGIETWVKLEAK